MHFLTLSWNNHCLISISVGKSTFSILTFATLYIQHTISRQSWLTIHIFQQIYIQIGRVRKELCAWFKIHTDSIVLLYTLYNECHYWRIFVTGVKQNFVFMVSFLLFWIFICHLNKDNKYNGPYLKPVIWLIVIVRVDLSFSLLEHIHILSLKIILQSFHS